VAGGHTLNIKQGPGPRNPSHPARIRAGQQFFPCSGPRRQRLTVKRLDGEWARVIRDDGSEVNVALDRLLAQDETGNGVHYRFHGWKQLSRGYRTELLVVDTSEDAGRCTLVLPEWDPSTEVEAILSVLPQEMRRPGATGSCRADLTSQSVAALNIHGCSRAKVKGLSRTAGGPHPNLLAEGQVFRRRSDRRKFRLLDVDPESPTVRAWDGGRVVRLGAPSLLELRPDGAGARYVYLGGGVAATRRRKARPPRRRPAGPRKRGSAETGGARGAGLQSPPN
jgi:hypothetical protein